MYTRFKCSFLFISIVFVHLLSSSNCQWPRSSPNPIQRKSWRFSESSSAQDSDPSYSQEYSHGNKCTFSFECDNPLNEYESLEKENPSPVTQTSRFPTKQPLIRLQNGTQFVNKRLEDRLQNPMEFISWSNTNRSKINGFEREFNKKILQDDNLESHLQIESPNKLNDTQPRIIAYNVNVNSTNNAAIQRMTLGQLVSKSLFPNWVWTRLGMNRKIDLFPLNVTKPTRVTTTNNIPAVTFDNNFTRFLNLFTVVRFENTPCVSSTGLNGTCYHSTECSSLSGTSTSSCAAGFGVCCIFQISCGQTTSRNGTYFMMAGSNSSSLATCNINLQKSTTAVTQIRLDFQTFKLTQPNAGNCEVDRFIVSGQNTNIPVICGENGGSHLYVEVAGQTSITLSVMTSGVDRVSRSLSILMTQYEAISPSNAPPHCLQYYTGLTGTIQSFNYITQASRQYLNNLNYAICIRKEVGFCSVTFANTEADGTYLPFHIVNANDHGQLVLPTGQAGIGFRDCPFDYILINGYRLCGERFNDGTTNILYVEDAPVTDTSNGPVIVSVRTNGLDVGAGFSLYYRQNPCMSMPG